MCSYASVLVYTYVYVFLYGYGRWMRTGRKANCLSGRMDQWSRVCCPGLCYLLMRSRWLMTQCWSVSILFWNPPGACVFVYWANHKRSSNSKRRERETIIYIILLFYSQLPFHLMIALNKHETTGSGITLVRWTSLLSRMYTALLYGIERYRFTRWKILFITHYVHYTCIGRKFRLNY